MDIDGENMEIMQSLLIILIVSLTSCFSNIKVSVVNES
jgi:hypothetical protein